MSKIPASIGLLPGVRFIESELLRIVGAMIAILGAFDDTRKVEVEEVLL